VPHLRSLYLLARPVGFALVCDGEGAGTANPTAGKIFWSIQDNITPWARGNSLVVKAVADESLTNQRQSRLEHGFQTPTVFFKLPDASPSIRQLSGSRVEFGLESLKLTPQRRTAPRVEERVELWLTSVYRLEFAQQLDASTLDVLNSNSAGSAVGSYFAKLLRYLLQHRRRAQVQQSRCLFGRIAREVGEL
jgi:hypothetical protein